MSKLKTILWALEEEREVLEEIFCEVNIPEFELYEDYNSFYLFSEILSSYEEECFGQTYIEDAETFVNKEILPNIDEDRTIRELIYVLYIQTKNITEVDTLDKFFGNYLHNFFILAAYLWLGDESDAEDRLKSWKEYSFDLVGLLEIGEILDKRWVYSKSALFIQIKNNMTAAYKEYV